MSIIRKCDRCGDDIGDGFVTSEAQDVSVVVSSKAPLGANATLTPDDYGFSVHLSFDRDLCAVCVGAALAALTTSQLKVDATVLSAAVSSAVEAESAAPGGMTIKRS